jgi:hypothetical protein
MATDTQFVERLERRAKALQDMDLKTFGLFDGPKQYVHSCNLFISCFKTIPSKIIMHYSDSGKLVAKIEKEFKEKILERYYMRYSIKKEWRNKFSNIVFIMENEIMIEIEMTGEVNILFNGNSEDEALQYEKAFRQRTHREKQNNIYLLAQGHFGPDITPLKVKKPVINFDTNYNGDLFDVHKYLLKTLKKKDNSGLVLFHGKPGTGKSTYIRFLICSLDKKVIFLPPSLASELDSPQFTRTLIDNPNSIFIIEDAEELIKSRESVGQSNISMLLNLTDGILGEALNTHIICTFNTDHKNIDEALLRKGRLLASYKFDDLSMDKLEKLKNSLGLGDFEINEGMSLSDLYHTKNNLFGNSTSKRKQVIGFS